MGAIFRIFHACRGLSGYCCILLAAAGTCFAGGPAAHAATASLPDDLTFSAAGEEVAVEVALDDGTGLTSYRIQLLYPSDQLTFVRAENGALTASWSAPVSFSPAAGRVNVVNANAVALSGGGTLVRLVFEV